MKTICIYHGNCADGFGAAWVVRQALGNEVIFHPGVYGNEPPDVTGADVLIVDFSYKRPVLERMAANARSLLVIDHHKTAKEDLAGFMAPEHGGYEVARKWVHEMRDEVPPIRVLFDMDHSGAMLTWRYFFPDRAPPSLLKHIEDRDLWRFDLDGTREIQACVFSHSYDFAVWDCLVERASTIDGRASLIREGAAIERKHHKDVAELIAVSARPMVIGGVEVLAANLPYIFASDAAGALAAGRPFGATYFDTPEGRLFSLRSRGDDGADVSAIAKLYGGGGHKNASGFRMPLGWDGDSPHGVTA